MKGSTAGTTVPPRVPPHPTFSAGWLGGESSARHCSAGTMCSAESEKRMGQPVKLLLSSLLVAGFLAGGVAQATSWYEYAERCVTDAEGRYYVVVKRKDDSKPYGPVTLTIAERRAGSGIDKGTG